MRRRQIALLGLVGVAAAAGGMAWSLRRTGSDDQPGDAALWDMRFERPEGGTLSLAALRGHPLLLNFWATWCAPCIKEMPMLDRFQREKQASGWAVVGLAVDQAEPVRQFLMRLPVHFPIGLAGTEGVDLSMRLGNLRGGLPFTVVLDGGGKVIDRHVGAIEPSHLEQWDRAASLKA